MLPGDPLTHNETPNSVLVIKLDERGLVTNEHRYLAIAKSSPHS
jgi:hypothetical protein